MGVVLYQQGRHAEAAVAFRRSMALEPDDADTLRNLAATLTRLGQDQEAQALRARANGIAPETARVVAMRVSFPADVTLAYVSAPGLEAALASTRAGRLDAALAAYRAHLGDPRSGAAAHLGVANELLRWHVALRLTAGQEPVREPDANIDPVRPTALFRDWVRQPDGRWGPVESVVTPSAAPLDGWVLAEEARRHYGQALSLGAGAAARIGLAALATETGGTEEAARQLAAARELDRSLPAALLSDHATRVAQR